MNCARGAVLAVVVLTFVSTRTSAQSSSRDVLEFGTDVTVSQNAGRAPTRSVTAPLSIRVGGFDNRHRLGAEVRFTLYDRRLESERQSAFSSATQLNYRLGNREARARSLGGPYLFGAISLTSTRAVLASTDMQRWLVGPQAGLGTRYLVPSGALRAELVAAYDPGSSRASSFVPTRTSVGLRLGYSVLKDWPARGR